MTEDGQAVAQGVVDAEEERGGVGAGGVRVRGGERLDKVALPERGEGAQLQGRLDEAGEEGEEGGEGEVALDGVPVAREGGVGGAGVLVGRQGEEAGEAEGGGGDDAAHPGDCSDEAGAEGVAHGGLLRWGEGGGEDHEGGDDVLLAEGVDVQQGDVGELEGGAVHGLEVLAQQPDPDRQGEQRKRN